MKTKKKTITMSILVFIGITLFYSVGWADRGLVLPTEIFYTCTNCGPAADKIVEVRVSFIRSDKLYERIKISAKDITDPKNILKAELVKLPIFRFLEKAGDREREFPVTNMGPNHQNIICTKKNYPVVISCLEGSCPEVQVHFIIEEKK